jgi:hypothetical protein
LCWGLFVLLCWGGLEVGDAERFGAGDCSFF